MLSDDQKVRIGEPVPMDWVGRKWYLISVRQGQDYAAREWLEENDVAVFMMEQRDVKRPGGRGPRKLVDDANRGKVEHLPAALGQPDFTGWDKIKVGTAEWEAWQDWFTANDYPALPTPYGDERWVWVPSKMPPPIKSDGDDLDDYESLG